MSALSQGEVKDLFMNVQKPRILSVNKCLFLLVKLSLSGLFLLPFKGIVFAQSTELIDSNKTGLSMSLGIDHQSYYNSGVTTSGLGFNFNYTSSQFEFKSFGVLQKQEGLESDFNLAFSVPELFYKIRVLNNSDLKLGRVLFDASKEHRDLELSGFWNNSWDYRKDDPIQEGLFGLFLERKRKNYDLQVFASFISVPKLVQHYDFNNEGGVENTTPWFALPPERITYSGNQYDVKYILEDLDYAALILKPQVGLSTRFNLGDYSTRLSYLYSTSREVDLGLSFLVDASTPSTPIELSIRPETVYFHKANLELTRAWGLSSKTTLSVATQVRQNDLPNEENFSWIGQDSGAYGFLAHEMKLLGFDAKAFLTLSSLSMSSTGELDNVLEDSLSVNYRFSNGTGLSLKKRLNSKLNLNMLGYVDAKHEGALGRLSISAINKVFSAELGLSFIEAFSGNSTGFYKDFRENDQIFTRVSYVF